MSVPLSTQFIEGIMDLEHEVASKLHYPNLGLIGSRLISSHLNTSLASPKDAKLNSPEDQIRDRSKCET